MGLALSPGSLIVSTCIERLRVGMGWEYYIWLSLLLESTSSKMPNEDEWWMNYWWIHWRLLNEYVNMEIWKAYSSYFMHFHLLSDLTILREHGASTVCKGTMIAITGLQWLICNCVPIVSTWHVTITSHNRPGIPIFHIATWKNIGSPGYEVRGSDLAINNC